jgi:hypothetical protein
MLLASLIEVFAPGRIERHALNRGEVRAEGLS